MTIAEREDRESPPIPGPVPWLVYPCGEDGIDQVFCTVSSSGPCIVHHKSIPELQGKLLLACFHGWSLLLEPKDDSLFLWNPLTLESIKLPPLPFKPDIGTSIFTSSPREFGCTVMIFEWDKPNILYCKIGGQKWSTHNYGNEIGELFDNRMFKYKDATFDNTVACMDGLVYAFTAYESHMVTIEIDEESRCNINNLGVRHPRSKQFSDRSRRQLLTHLGELYVINTNCQGHCCVTEIVGFEIFKLDFSEKVWMKVESLNDWSIFLGNEVCDSSVAIQSGIEGNKIFFTLYGDEHLYTYDLMHGGILTSLPCPTLQDPWFEPFWMIHDRCLPDTQAEAQLKVTREGRKLSGHVGAEEDVKAEDYDIPFRHLNILYEDEQWPYHYLDMFIAVTRHLELRDYLHFRATCRFFRLAAPIQWRAACIAMETMIPPPSFISLEAKVPSPLLLTFRNDRCACSFTDPKHHETYYMTIPESLVGTTLCYSKEGYLLLVDGKSSTFFNPFTRTEVRLPRSYSYSFSGLTFSSVPSCSDFLVVEIYNFASKIEVCFCRPGQDVWDMVKFDSNVEFSTNGLGSVFCDGKFYILSNTGKLGVFKFDGEGSSWDVLAGPEAPCREFVYSYLMEYCDRELLAVFVGHFGCWVKVFRLDRSEMAWVSVTSLGSYALFVSNTSAFSTIARSSSMENKIYFPRFHGKGIVYYSLETGKFHTHGSDIELDDFYGTTEQLYCGWIEPRSS